jgi:transcriptional regulator with XRE-family HTH domain
MELLSVIRRWALRDQLSIREIARGTGLSRNTIRRYLRGDVVEPAFKVRERPSKLDRFAEKLVGLAKAGEQQAAQAEADDQAVACGSCCPRL